MSEFYTKRKLSCREDVALALAIFVVFLDFVNAIVHNSDTQLRTSIFALIVLLFALSVRKFYPNPSRKIWPWISPIYDNGVMIIVAIFFLFHVTLLNVPILNVDLYNVYENGDIIGHSLGGLMMWTIFAKVALEYSRLNNKGWSAKTIVKYSMAALLVIGVLWEFIELAASLTILPHVDEPINNKIRDIIMEYIGAGLMTIAVLKTKYPFDMGEWE
ncbi:hypothetical protein E3E38_08855 [Thermococcus sp. 18S1]|uniref:hypothetical protein n=1 Tax=Thermococcus sp. 18S1 TaxID=1638210 RepID=UPI00143B0A41|nr:hypothetical protein [Thermococcus sp. 18S1]NJE31150.1 hypothetical protein [Thermococcus sp. 18S1]